MPHSPPDQSLLEGLNPVQHEAVVHDEGPLLVIAGAGSGKTRVLTSRIAHLISRGVSPFEILAITFTNKAAEEMKHRVGALVGPVAEKMWVSTFHSACVRILRRDGQRLGYPSSFTIYDQADAQRLTGYVVRDLNLDPKRFPNRSVHAVISAAKNDDIGPEQYATNATVIFERKIADVYTEYQARLQKAGAMDFDDLLRNAVELLRTEPEVLEHYRRRFQHVLVDEYQDTNKVQNELVLLLAGEHHNVCIVGDSDQCLLPGTLVSTPAGPRPIEELAVGDEVLGAAARPGLVPAAVAAVHPGSYQGRVYRVSAGTEEVTGTPHHVVLARPSLDPDHFVVYLMERSDRGFRIGRTMSTRPRRKGEPDLGPRVRLNQEHGDRLWILGLYATAEEAAWWESWFSAQYGLLTACFHNGGDSWPWARKPWIASTPRWTPAHGPRSCWRTSTSTWTSPTCRRPTAGGDRRSTSPCSATPEAARSAITGSNGPRTVPRWPTGCATRGSLYDRGDSAAFGWRRFDGTTARPWSWPGPWPTPVACPSGVGPTWPARSGTSCR